MSIMRQVGVALAGVNIGAMLFVLKDGHVGMAAIHMVMAVIVWAASNA